VSAKMFYVIGFVMLMLFDTGTQVAFKLAANQAGVFEMTLAWLKAALCSPWIYGSVAGYLGAFFTWMTLLKRAPVGPAFAASHLEVITVLIVSRWLFGEQLAPLQGLGALCIVLGIVALSLSQSRNPHG
jgi:drug/metabolite transporter (DMT)-like permease